MIDQYFLVLTTIDLFVLTFMCILTKLSETLNGKQKRGFFLAFALIGVISILEVITILVDGAPVHLRCLNILSNYLGFGLSPAVSACLVYALDKKTVISRKFKAAVGCEVCSSSPRCSQAGWCFPSARIMSMRADRILRSIS